MQEMKKILTIVAEYPPYCVGGIGLNAYDLNCHVDSKKYQMITITFTMLEEMQIKKLNETIYIGIPQQNVVVEKSYEEKYICQNKDIIQAFEKIQNERLIDFNDVELIILHGYFLAGAAVHVANKLKKPLLYYLHVQYASKLYNKNVISYDEYNILKKANAVIAVSEFVLNEANKMSGIINKSKIIAKAIEFDYIENISEIQRDEHLFLYVGRLSEEKGIEVLFEAFTKYCKDNDKAKLYCIGTFVNDEYRENIIKKYFSDNELNRNVIFIGNKSRESIYRYMKIARAIIVPSYNETFGKVAVEAMACKCLAIVSDVGGLGPLVTDRRTGFKFHKGNDEELYKILRTIGDFNVDKIIEEAYEYAIANYTWQKIIAESNQFIFEKIGIASLYEE